ncbi:MAG: tetratricopeptide repeat protein, partial [Geitlerinemataceae cyanobacterium]
MKLTLLVVGAILGQGIVALAVRAEALSPRPDLDIAQMPDWSVEGNLLERLEAETFLRLGEEKQRLGEFDEAIEALLQAVARYRRLQDFRGMGVAYRSLGALYEELGRLDKALEARQNQLGMALSAEDSRGQLDALNDVGEVLLLQGKFDRAVLVFEQGYLLAQTLKSPIGQAVSLNNLGLAAMGLENYAEAVKQFEEAMRWHYRGASPIDEATTLNNLGAAYWAIEDYDNTIGTYGEALRVAKLNLDRPNHFRAIDGLAEAHRRVGRYFRAEELLEERLALARVLEDGRQEMISLELFARLY